jgi:hypothetical protein
MTLSGNRPQGRSQSLTSDSDDKIIIDRKTVKRLRSLATRCAEELLNPRDCTVFLESLDSHLTESTVPEPQRTSQALLLLKVYRDVVPDALEEVTELLEELREILGFILRASELGGDE